MPISEEMKAQGWIEHDGGPCPVPLGTAIETMSREGEIYQQIAGPLGWGHFPDFFPQIDIIAYRLENRDG